MASPVPVSSATYCSRCGYQLGAGPGFCAACGASRSGSGPTSANATSPLIGFLTSSTEDIEALERSALEKPDDEGYRKLLAVALYDDAMKDWWEDPEDKCLLCVSVAGLAHARKQLERASQLQFNDPQLRERINAGLQLVHSMERRKFVGSWLMVVVLGFFYVIPGAIWWYVNRRPGYLINNDYMKHQQTGKHRGASPAAGS
jgi:hypothetical protein